MTPAMSLVKPTLQVDGHDCDLTATEYHSDHGPATRLWFSGKAEIIGRPATRPGLDALAFRARLCSLARVTPIMNNPDDITRHLPDSFTGSARMTGGV
jgi:hypothetical protein